MTNHDLEAAYEYCQEIAKTHYENFPVASVLLPKKLRRPVSVIYTFARIADDYADEGNLDSSARIDALNEMSARLTEIKQDISQQEPLFIALHDVIKNFSLPLTLFQDLLTAFRMDVTKKRYQNLDEVLEYCHYSANPVGRLLLHLYQADTPQNLAWSDDICSALQLINFLQDIEQDYHEMGRIYIPLDDMKKYDISELDIKTKRDDPITRNLINEQIDRARNLLLSGTPLGRTLKGRIGLELRMIITGGMRILDKMNKQNEGIYSRPRLNNIDRAIMLIKAIFDRYQ